MAIQLRAFQRRFLKHALAPSCDTAALSLPRANGKTSLCAHILTRCLTPGDPLNKPGAEYLLCAASIEQARLCFRPIRADLEPTGEYRFLDSATRIGIVHKPTNTRMRVLSSNAKSAMGLLGVPLVVADEPGSWEVLGGELMHDALETAKGKPDSPLRTIYVGTLAPSVSGWWHDLIADGSHGSTFTMALKGNPKKWDKWPEIKRCNPLTAVSPKFRKKLLEERDAALADTRKKARFMSYRLNVPTGDETTTLLSVDDFQAVCGRPVGSTDGTPVVGVDLGQSRAWSACVCIYPSGRIEALALAGGIPDIRAMEKRDRVPKTTYQRLVDDGVLLIDKGLRVPRPSILVDHIVDTWRPKYLVADRFRVDELTDTARGRVRVIPRVTRYSESSADIRALRRLAVDGPLNCDEGSRKLIAASLSVSTVKYEEGNSRLVKSKNNTARDDVAAALLLAAGLMVRVRPTKKAGFALCT